MGKPLGRITIAGYKSIRALENFELRPLNIMIGANGSGKTNFISAFKLLNQILAKDLQSFVGQMGGADALLYFGKRTTDEIVLRLTFENNGYNIRLVPAAGDSLIFNREEVWFQGAGGFNQPFSEILGSGHKETKLYELSQSSPHNTIAEYVIDALKSWKVYHFHDTSPSSRMKKTVDINDNKVLLSDAANLPAFLYMLKETKPEYYKRIADTIRLVAPFFSDFSLRPNPLNPNTILLRWREKGAESDFDVDVLSDGTLRFMCLATLLLQPELPSTILIDEPELGLHPYAINLLASLLSSTAARTQVIVATQSAALVSHFSPEDIIVVDRVDGQSVFKRQSTEELEHWLEEYSLGELWEKNVLGGRPR